MARDDNQDYPVGYRRPPLHSRFKPGQSGHPRGRPKGTPNLKTDLIAELSERVLVREGTRVRRYTKQRLSLKALSAKALKGDVKAIHALLTLTQRLLGSEIPQEEASLTTDEQQIMTLLLERAKLCEADAALPMNLDDLGEADESAQ